MASALLVVARMVGMLVGISALTTIGLRRYYAVESDIPSPNSVCGGDKTRCAAYTRLIEQAGIEQLQAIFLGRRRLRGRRRGRWRSSCSAAPAPEAFPPTRRVLGTR